MERYQPDAWTFILDDDALLEASGLRETLATWRAQGVAACQSAGVGLAGDLYRLPRHHRSYCVQLAPVEDGLVHGSCLVVKGTEPALPDRDDFISWMKSRPLRGGSGHRAMLDAFPFTEAKIPGALSAHEATLEAQVALDVHRRHLAVYGELAPLPLPLLVGRHADAVTQRFADSLRAAMLPRAYERIEPMIAEGLALYVYHFPDPPLRADYFASLTTQFVRPPKFLTRALRAKVGAAVEGWLTLCARLLCMGWLPFTAYNDRLGSLVDVGNLCMNGGACDVDSILPMADAPTPGFVAESLRHVISQLVDVLARLHSVPLVMDHDQRWFGMAVGQLLATAIEREQRAGAQPADDVRAMLDVSSAAGLAALTARLIPPARPDYKAPGRGTE